MLRLLTAALIIIALAGPSIGTPPKTAGSGPLVLFIDNDWTAAHAWKAREAAISDALAGAARQGRPVAIVPTASGHAPQISLLDAGRAARSARELAPQGGHRGVLAEDASLQQPVGDRRHQEHEAVKCGGHGREIVLAHPAGDEGH